MKDNKQMQPSSPKLSRENKHKVQKSTAKGHRNESHDAEDEPVTEESPDTAKPAEIGDDPEGTKKKIPQLKK
ncbi:hypothetical protein ACX0G9_01315 [Flavitalea flava]